MEKFTKIVATIGPASDSRSMIEKLRKSGMDVARLNFSHGDHDYFKKVINTIRSVDEDIAIMLDTKGPEIRTGDVKGGSIELVEGVSIKLTDSPVLGDPEKLTIHYPKLGTLNVGNTILIDDGLIELEVIDKRKGHLVAEVRNGGVLGSRKTVSIKGHDVDIPFLSEKDKEDIIFGINENLSLVAASFVRRKEDVVQLRNFLERYSSKIKIISKIEHWNAVENIQEIIEASDGIMVARGDLGVEVSLEKVPRIQEEIIRACNEVGKPVIVATQMLESMKENPRPTRAEVSDVAQAILQGADAIMLSGETADGKYPVQAVKMFAKIANEYDKKVETDLDKKEFPKRAVTRDTIALFVTKAAYLSSETLGTRAILTPTETGFTARMVSRFRPRCPILAITPDITVFRQLQLSWGVVPMLEIRRYTNLDDMVDDLVKKGYKRGLIGEDDRVVITAGYKLSEKGHTNLIEIYFVRDILERNQA